MSKEHPKKAVLIDDDESFRIILKAAARARGLDMQVFGSLAELRIGRLGEYDVIIVDYHLDAVSGLDISNYIQAFLGCKTPVLLVSASHVDELRKIQWPPAVRRVISKQVGAQAIIESALNEVSGHRNPLKFEGSSGELTP